MKPPPLGRRPRETAKAFEAFCVYAELGPSRSLARAVAALAKRHQNTTKRHPPLDSLKDWSRRYSWVSRAREYDDALAKIAAAETARVVKVDARATAERRSAMAADLEAMADELRERFKKMLAHPMTEQRVAAGEDGEVAAR